MLSTLKQRLKNRKGFTLIELIVVIAIIAILAAVLIPRLAGFTDSAKERAVLSDARNIITAASAILADDPEATVTETAIENLAGDLNGTLNYTGTGDVITFTYTLNGWRITVTDGELGTPSVAPAPAPAPAP